MITRNGDHPKLQLRWGLLVFLWCGSEVTLKYIKILSSAQSVVEFYQQ